MEKTPSLSHQDTTAAAPESESGALHEDFAEHDDWPLRRPEDHHPASDAPLAVMTGPLPSQLAVSLFREPASTQTRPIRQEMSWPQLVRLLSEHDERDNKDGRDWSPEAD